MSLNRRPLLYSYLPSRPPYVPLSIAKRPQLEAEETESTRTPNRPATAAPSPFFPSPPPNPANTLVRTTSTLPPLFSARRSLKFARNLRVRAPRADRSRDEGRSWRPRGRGSVPEGRLPVSEDAPVADGCSPRRAKVSCLPAGAGAYGGSVTARGPRYAIRLLLLFIRSFSESPMHRERVTSGAYHRQPTFGG